MIFGKEKFQISEKLIGYRLEENPFPPKTLEFLPENLDSLFKNWVVSNQINFFRNIFRKNATKGSVENFWILKNEDFPNQYNLIVIAGLFRTMVNEKDPEIFSVYSTLPVLHKNVPEKIWEFFADRFFAERFRKAAYTFLLSELSSLSEDEARKFLPSVDIPELVRVAEETDGEVLDDIFFPPSDEERELQKAEESKQPSVEEDETEDSEDSGTDTETIENGESEENGQAEKEGSETTGKPEGGNAESLPELEDNRANELISFLELKLLHPPFAKPVYQALISSLKKGFGVGRLKLQDLREDYREALDGLLKLTDMNFASAFLMVDYLEGWMGLDDLEKAHFIGSILEFSLSTGAKAFAVLISLPQTREEMNAFRDFAVQPIDFKDLRRESEPLKPEAASEVISSFLSADLSRMMRREETDDELFPFTEDGISELCGIANDWSDFLVKTGKSIEAGAKAGFVAIDADFIKSNLS